MRSRASSFNWQYPLLSLRSSSSFLRLLPRLLVTSFCPFIFPSITCFRRQFLRKMWPIQLAFRFLISCRIFLCSLTLSNTSSSLTWSVQLIFSILLQHHISKLSRRFWSVARSLQVSVVTYSYLQLLLIIIDPGVNHSLTIKSNPITGLDRTWGFQEGEVPKFQDNRHMKVVRLSALRTGRPYHPGNIPGTHFC